MWQRATLAEILAANPGAQLMTLEQWIPLAEAAEITHFCKPPAEVNEARWWDLLEAMFPMNWRGTGSAEESFMLAECYTGSLHVCMVRIGDRYAEMIRPKSSTHAQLCNEARALFAGGFVPR